MDNKKILIIGDSCKDVFVYCNCKRLCPEAPVPLLDINNSTTNPGMAYNVFKNVESLYGSAGITITTNENWESITKTRYVDVDTNHMFIRIDSPVKPTKINLSEIDFDYELIAISDYNKGYISEQDIQWITEKHNNVFIDTKKHLGNWINKAKIIKINNVEYDLTKSTLSKEVDQKIIKTMGKDGCMYKNVVYPVTPVNVMDVSGAGDTFLAALIVKYLQTQDIQQSIISANLCASHVVSRRGVSVI